MKFVKKILVRVDEATLRERVLLFVAMAVVLIAVVDSLVLSPIAEKERKLRAATAGYQAELDTDETYIRNMVNSRGVDPDGPARARRRTLLDQIGSLNTQIGQEQQRFASPEGMRSILEETLRATPGVALLKLTSLPAETLTDVASAPVPVEGERMRIFRHGFELTVSGSYADVYTYLRRLERMPRIYWAKAEYAVRDYPGATLKLTVYTLSLDRTWMRV